METTRTCRKCQETYLLNETFWGHQPNGSYRKTCRVCERQRNRTWNHANPRRQAERSRRYQATKDRWQPSAQLKVDLFHKADGLCRYCNAALTSDAQVDHAIPIGKGGSNDITNLDLICKRCNQEKNHKTPDEYAAWKQRTA